MTADGKKMIVGGTYLPKVDSKTSPVALVDISSTLQATACLKLPSRSESLGCKVVRRVSKKNFFLACTSEAVYLVSEEGTDLNPELHINLKIPHCHAGTLCFTKA